MSTIRSTKRTLRRDLRQRRQAFVAALPALPQDRAFSVAPSPLAQLLEASAIIGAYWPVDEEANPLRLVGNRLVALPWFADRDAPMAFRLWQAPTRLEPDPFGAMQPPATAPSAEPGLLLMPLLGFDRSLNRLGQGAAYYDRFCAAHPDALRIGIAWSVQEESTIPCEVHDMRLDAVLTEREWIVAGQGRI